MRKEKILLVRLAARHRGARERGAPGAPGSVQILLDSLDSGAVVGVFPTTGKR